MTGLHWEDDGSNEGLLTRRSAQICLSDNEIEDFLFDRLSGVTREVIEEHLLACGSCLNRIEKEEAFIASFRAAATEIESEDLKAAYHGRPAEPPKRWLGFWKSRWLAWTFAGVFAVLLGGGVYFSRSHTPLTEAQIALHVERGAGLSEATALAGQPLRLVPDLTGLPQLPAFTFSLVDSVGRPVHSEQVSPASGRVEVPLPRGLPSGSYWVRLSTPAPASELLREYGLRIR